MSHNECVVTVLLAT